jgi:hypothetical protein
MFMLSLTILFLSGTSRFMDEHVKKLRLLLKSLCVKKALWLPKGRGRPSVGENVVELLLDMKQSN